MNSFLKSWTVYLNSFFKRNQFKLVKTQKTLIESVNFTDPILIIFLLQYLSFGEIIFLTALKLSIRSLVEIPEEIINRTLSKRAKIMSSAILSCLTFITLLSGIPSLFVLGFVFLGISEALSHGLERNLVFSKIKGIKANTDFKKVLDWLIEKEGILFLTLILGGIIAFYNIRLNLLLMFFNSLIIFAITLKVKELPNIKEIDLKKVSKVFEKSYGSLINDNSGRNILFLSTIFLSTTLFINLYDQLILASNGVSLILFGVFYAVLNLLELLSKNYSYQFEHRFSVKNFINKSILILSFLMILLGLTNNVFLVIILILSRHALVSFTKPLFNEFINGSIKNRNKPSFLSFKNMVQFLTFLIFGLIFKSFNDFYGFRQTLIFSAIIILLILPLIEINQKVFKKKADF